MIRLPYARALALLAGGIVLFSAGMATAHRQGAGRAAAPAGRLPERTSAGEAGRSVFPLRTEIRLEGSGAGAHRTVIGGTGTVLFGRYVLTVAHAVTLDRPDSGEPADAPPSSATGTEAETSTTWLVGGGRRMPLTPLGRDVRADVALFALPDGADLPSLPCPIADSTMLALGDEVALLGRDPEAGAMFRPAAVAALRASELVRSVSDNDQVFLMSLALTAGESGSPIVAFRDGGCLLVGLAQGTYVGPRQLAWAIRIEPVLGALARQTGDEPATESGTTAASLTGRPTLELAGLIDPTGAAPAATAGLADFLRQAGRSPAARH